MCMYVCMYVHMYIITPMLSCNKSHAYYLRLGDNYNTKIQIQVILWYEYKSFLSCPLFPHISSTSYRSCFRFAPATATPSWSCRVVGNSTSATLISRRRGAQSNTQRSRCQVILGWSLYLLPDRTSPQAYTCKIPLTLLIFLRSVAGCPSDIFTPKIPGHFDTTTAAFHTPPRAPKVCTLNCYTIVSQRRARFTTSRSWLFHLDRRRGCVLSVNRSET